MYKMISSIQIKPSIDLSSLETFIKNKVLPASVNKEQEPHFDIGLYKELHNLGWLQAFIPKELGGVGLSLPDLCWVIRTIAYGSAGVSTTLIANVLGMSPVLHFASESLKMKLVSESLSKLTLWSFGMTEPDTGTDIGDTKTRAKKVENGYILQGKKCFITNGNYSDHFVVFARVEPNPSSKPKITAFYVPGSATGLKRGQSLKKLGQMESNTTELFFDDIFVPSEHRIGEEGEGLKVASHCLLRSKTLFAASAAGICDRALEITTFHLSQRTLYKKPLITIPTIQNVLVNCHTQAQAAWLMTCLAAEKWESGQSALREVSMAKMFAADCAVNTVSETLELFGGYGYTKEYEIEKLYRDAKILEMIEGSTLIQQILASKSIFKNYIQNPSSNKERIDGVFSFKKAA